MDYKSLESAFRNWKIAASITMSLAVIMLLFSLYGMSTSSIDILKSDLLADSNHQMNKLIIDVQNQQVEINSLKSMLSTSNVTKLPSSSILISRINDLSRRQAVIEGVILNSPEKALEIPFMRSEIDDMKTKNASEIASLAHSIDALYDLVKYVVISIFGSIVLLAITNFIRPRT